MVFKVKRIMIAAGLRDGNGVFYFLCIMFDIHPHARHPQKLHLTEKEKEFKVADWQLPKTGTRANANKLIVPAAPSVDPFHYSPSLATPRHATPCRRHHHRQSVPPGLPPPVTSRARSCGRVRPAFSF
ncbi:hypothetical protein N658DRAFT_219798 [Parathielavia hyrcaniae]|uniref:Uncharacterized protein n=1 Tax=Parathielavia hyrcaniae TaxID=113614 RepID=A0AAN6PV22_9PEZI|nr:hypothetical protein N658DRAFT_219798 [Parathielavia hyrcaniae]